MFILQKANKISHPLARLRAPSTKILTEKKPPIDPTDINGNIMNNFIPIYLKISKTDMLAKQYLTTNYSNTNRQSE